MSPGNQGVFQLLKEVTFRRILVFYQFVGRATFVRLMGWWDWPERNGITTALMISDTTKLMMSRFLLIMSVLCSSKVYRKPI